MSLVNLEIIVRWKSERVVHYLIGNSEEKIRQALAVAASPESSTRRAVEALTGCGASTCPWRRRFYRPFIRTSMRCWISGA